jgi:hypothetical protein
LVAKCYLSASPGEFVYVSFFSLFSFGTLGLGLRCMTMMPLPTAWFRYRPGARQGSLVVQQPGSPFCLGVALGLSRKGGDQKETLISDGEWHGWITIRAFGVLQR